MLLKIHEVACLNVSASYFVISGVCRPYRVHPSCAFLLYEESEGDVGVVGRLFVKGQFLECFGVKNFFDVVRKGLNCGCFRESNVLCAFLRLHISDAKWSRQTRVHCAHSIHCFWRVF